jgi:hypothetical protein
LWPHTSHFGSGAPPLQQARYNPTLLPTKGGRQIPAVAPLLLVSYLIVARRGRVQPLCSFVSRLTEAMQEDSQPSEDDFRKAEGILKSGIDLLSSIEKSRSEIREKSKLEYGSGLLDAHLLVTGVLHETLSRKSLIPGKTNKSITNRRVLIVSFIQGIPICEEAISEGLYVQAAALVRQELETVAAIEEVIENVREDGKTPNVKHVPWQMNRLYGELNTATHVSDHRYLAEIYRAEERGDAKPVSVIPTYREGAARNLYAIHVGLLIQVAMHLHEVQVEAYGEDEGGLKEYELMMIMRAADILNEEGLLEGENS